MAAACSRILRQTGLVSRHHTETCTDTELQVTLFLVVELEWAMKHDSAFKSKFFNTFNTTKSVQKDTVSSEVLLDKSVVPKTISCSHSQVKVKKID